MGGGLFFSRAHEKNYLAGQAAMSEDMPGQMTLINIPLADLSHI
jgi:hypothetical protein